LFAFFEFAISFTLFHAFCIRNRNYTFVLYRFYRAMLCIRGGTSHEPMSVCVCVCLCPCLSQAGVLLKRQNARSHKQHHTIPHGLLFSGAKDLREIRPGSPPAGRQMQVGWVKIGDIRQITGYISKTVQNRRVISIKVE